jgi:hypothetical protein
MFSVKIDVVHSVLELHLGGPLSEHQLTDFAQELKLVLSSMPEPPLGVLLERKTARPSNQQVERHLANVCKFIQESGARHFADVGAADVASVGYDERSRRFNSEEEARRWLLQPSSKL